MEYFKGIATGFEHNIYVHSKDMRQGGWKGNLEALAGCVAKTTKKGGACLAKAMYNMKLLDNPEPPHLPDNANLRQQTKHKMKVVKWPKIKFKGKDNNMLAF